MGREVERALHSLEPAKPIDRDAARKKASPRAAEQDPPAPPAPVSAHAISALAADVHVFFPLTNSVDGWRRTIVGAIGGDYHCRMALGGIQTDLDRRLREMIARAEYERAISRAASAGEAHSNGRRDSDVRHSATLRSSMTGSELR